MKYWNVYERRPANDTDLKFVMTVQAPSAQQAMNDFLEKFGMNYGCIVVLPTMPWVPLFFEK